MALGDVLARLSVQLGLDSAAFESGARRAGDQTRELGDRMERMGTRVGGAIKGIVALGGAIAGSAVVGKLQDMATAGLEHASSLGEQAMQLGVSTSALQFYRYAATQVGIEQDTMDKGLARLTLTLGKLALGTDKQREALGKYGFSTKEAAALSKLTAEQALPVLADKYRALGSETEKAAFVAEIFGSKLGGQFKTLLNDGAAGIEKLAAAYKSLGIEISPEQIAAADEAMDKSAQNQLVLQSKVAIIAAANAEAITKSSLAWEELKVNALDAVAKSLPVLDQLNTQYIELGDSADKLGENLGIHAFVNAMAEELAEGGRHLVANVKMFRDWGVAVYDTVVKIPGYVDAMVTKIGTAITTRLNAVWQGAMAKVAEVKASFFNLLDAVVLHSYIPDMVDLIAVQMQRLDGVMVDPAQKATDATKKRFETLRDDVRGIMDDLFPEARAIADDQGRRAKLEAAIAAGGMGDYTPDQLRAGLQQMDSRGLSDVSEGLTGFGAGVFDKIRNGMGGVIEAGQDLAAKTATIAGQITTSFEDTANGTLAALQRMTSAIKGGGFLDILSGVIGLGLQLGSIGAFGKNIQTKLKVPAYAGGTNFHPGGMALVGERGPELLNMPRGSSVTPNNKIGGMSKVQIIPSPYFQVVVDGRIQRAAPTIVGASVAESGQRTARSQSRRVG